VNHKAPANRKREGGSDAKAEIAAVREARQAAADGAVEIGLRHARDHHLRWIVIGVVLGGLCVSQLGTLGQGAGVILLALAGWSAFRVIQTLRHPPGTFVIDGDRCSVPRGLCRGEPLALPRQAITATYLLRKAVAWHQAAPVLVVEAEGKVLAYPRDWFASEADQRRLLDALATADAATSDATTGDAATAS
jgi:hypothetical protein